MNKQISRLMHTIPVRPLVAAKFLTFGALAALLLFLSGCHWVGVKGNGRIVTQDRTISNFTTLVVDGAYEVNWTPGVATLSIRTDENLMEYIRTDMSGDKLRIEWIKPLKGTRGIKINVASPSLTGVQLNGAVRFTASKMAGQDFVLEANGATRVSLEGTLNGMSASLNGASRLDADSLRTRTSEVAINGAGRAEVNATETLRVAIAGAGKVEYVGDPRVEQQINGAGRVRRRD